MYKPEFSFAKCYAGFMEGYLDGAPRCFYGAPLIMVLYSDFCGYLLENQDICY